MKIQFDWLKQYVDSGLPAYELGHLLTMAGLEIEAHETVILASGKKDDVLELNVTPNRGYCLSHIGVAREVAALTDNPLNLPRVELSGESNPGTDLINRLQVQNDAPDLCPRYAAMVIDQVKVGPSPGWLVDRLHAIGLRPINNVVDITNFVLMEFGQPLHAFDLDLLEGKQIIIRRAKNGEAFTALDGTELKLAPEALVIADATRPVALAGIMGGSNSQVSASTRTIALESACFDPVNVRKTSKQYSLRSDSSYRFERGVNIEAVITAQQRAAEMIQELAGGQILEGRFDLYPDPKPRITVPFRVDRCNSLLGTQLETREILRYLTALGIEFKEEVPGGTFQATLPHSRPDLGREVDLIEEVARLSGYDKIEASAPLGRMRPVQVTPLQKLVRETRAHLQSIGFMEAINYSFIESHHADLFQSAFSMAGSKTVSLDNPISSDLSTLRTSLQPGLIKTAVRNINHGEKSLRLFEHGQAFFMDEGGKQIETPVLGCLMTGPLPPDVWKASGKSYDFYDLKGVLDSLAAGLKIEMETRRSSSPFLNPGSCIDLMAGETRLGYLGQLHPETARVLDLEQTAFILELDLDKLSECRPRALHFEPLPRFPGMYRDISILIAQNVSSKEAEEVIREAGAPLLKQVTLYDHFEGKKLEAGQKSLTFSLTFQNPERTLTDDEVNPVFDRIVSALGDRLKARLRD